MKRMMLIWLLALSFSMLLSGSPAAAESVADLYRKSYAAEAAGKYDDALVPMKKISKLTGESYFVVARIGWLSYLAGKHTDAEKSYQKGIKLEPKAIEPRLGLTLPLLAQKKKLRELEKASREVIKLDPKNAIARSRLAHALYGLRNYPDAAVIYRQLVAEYPADLNHKTGLAWALARLGKVAEAKKIFREVLAVSPDNPNANAGMALP